MLLPQSLMASGLRRPAFLFAVGRFLRDLVYGVLELVSVRRFHVLFFHALRILVGNLVQVRRDALLFSLSFVCHVIPALYPHTMRQGVRIPRC